MKLNKNNTKKFIVLGLCATMFACADAPKKEIEEETVVEEEMTAEVETMDEDDSFMLPSPIQIAAIFNRAGLEYQSGLTNPTSNVSNYNTKTAKYLNFGVYSADLAYAVLNGKQQASIDYLNAIRSLSDEIGMPSVFGSGSLMKSFEKNIDNQDTVLSILTTIKSRTDDYLAENGDQSKEAIFFSSAWVEGMYLGAKSAEGSSKITPRIIEQMTILENIIKAVSTQQDKSLDMTFMVEGLKEIKSTFEGFKEVKELDNSDEGLGEIKLTKEELKLLTDEISALRTKIING